MNDTPIYHAMRVLDQQHGDHDKARRQLEQLLLLIEGRENQKDLAATIRESINLLMSWKAESDAIALANLGVHRA